jgi:hypothetical protein
MLTFLDFTFDATTNTTDGRLATFFENEVTVPLDESLGLLFSLAYAGPDTREAINTNDNPVPKVFLFNITTSALDTQ